ncbi:unnamed protein product, partial [Ilex paraguariensis]
MARAHPSVSGAQAAFQMVPFQTAPFQTMPRLMTPSSPRLSSSPILEAWSCLWCLTTRALLDTLVALDVHGAPRLASTCYLVDAGLRVDVDCSFVAYLIFEVNDFLHLPFHLTAIS